MLTECIKFPHPRVVEPSEFAEAAEGASGKSFSAPSVPPPTSEAWGGTELQLLQVLMLSSSHLAVFSSLEFELPSKCSHRC